jgi:hypothetical protein
MTSVSISPIHLVCERILKKTVNPKPDVLQDWVHLTESVFHYRHVTVSSQLKSKVVHILAKVTTFHINLNIDGATIPSRSHTHPSHPQTSQPRLYFRCPRPPWNLVYTRCVDPSVLSFSFLITVRYVMSDSDMETWPSTWYVVFMMWCLIQTWRHDHRHDIPCLWNVFEKRKRWIQKLNDVKASRQGRWTRWGMWNHSASERRSRCVIKWMYFIV